MVCIVVSMIRNYLNYWWMLKRVMSEMVMDRCVMIDVIWLNFWVI